MYKPPTSFVDNGGEWSFTFRSPTIKPPITFEKAVAFARENIPTTKSKPGKGKALELFLKMEAFLKLGAEGPDPDSLLRDWWTKENEDPWYWMEVNRQLASLHLKMNREMPDLLRKWAADSLDEKLISPKRKDGRRREYGHRDSKIRWVIKHLVEERGMQLSRNQDAEKGESAFDAVAEALPGVSFSQVKNVWYKPGRIKKT